MADVSGELPARSAAVAPAQPGDPTTIGPYAVIGRLGSGGMGRVYLARAAGGDPVAVKVVRAELAADEGFRRRFADEVAAARQVADFCTAPVLDADPDAPLPYLVTEYIDGVRLDRMVIDNGPLTGSTLTGLAVGIATALVAIHRAGLVHRDLKPSNVLLSLSGPRVIDFGIARSVRGTREASSGGLVFGSAGWMAPEQINGLDVEPSADVFSWGILVAYAGTGRNPFGTGQDVDVAFRIVTGAPDLVGLEDPPRRLVVAALAKNPTDRPTAQDLLLGLIGGGGAGAGAVDRTVLATPGGPGGSGVSGASAESAVPAGAGPDPAGGAMLLGLAGELAAAGIAPTLLGAPTFTGRAIVDPLSGAGPDLTDRDGAGGDGAGGGVGGSGAGADASMVWPAARGEAAAYAEHPPGWGWPVARGAGSGQGLSGQGLSGQGLSGQGQGPVDGSGWPGPAGFSPGPVAPHRPAATRRRRIAQTALAAVITILLLIVVLAVVTKPGGHSGGPGAAATSTRPSPTPSPTPTPTAATDGQLAFTVDRVTCGVQQVGSGWFAIRPDGQLCLAVVTARNVGTQARTLLAPRQYLYDNRGSRHSANIWSRFLISGEHIWDNIHPGDVASGTMVFDIPADARPDHMVLHDGPLSGGATVPL